MTTIMLVKQQGSSSSRAPEWKTATHPKLRQVFHVYYVRVTRKARTQRPPQPGIVGKSICRARDGRPAW